MSQAIGNAGLNAASAVFNFAIALLLSRLLGAEGYGAYAFAVAWAMLLAVPAVLGLPSVVVRELATYRVRGDWSRARGLIRRANQAVLVASAAIVGVILVAFLTLGWPDSPLRGPTLIGLVLVPLVAVISIRQCAMQGFGNVVLGRVPETLVAPALTIALVLILQTALAGGITARGAVAAHVMAAALTALLGAYLLRRTLPSEVQGAQPRDEIRRWLVAAMPLLSMGGIQAVNAQAGTILTGAIAGPQEAGIFGVSVRVAGLLPFLLLAAVPPLMPRVAELHERAELERLQRLLTTAARMVFLGSLPIALAVIVFAGPLLDLFGDDFGTGVTALRILCLGQLVNLATGFAGMILIMTGEAGQLVKAVAAGTVVNLVLAAVLIPGL
ncbi:MAG TPA: oligosaccharide flippase family protein, partial [Longimicrobiales bacterium]|nr:oligosaccharide flippase family protein [Longimicrobiales bacterium]